jgi:hypothetical protein
MFTSDQTPDLDPKFSTALESALEDLRSEFSTQLQEARKEIQELKTQMRDPLVAPVPVHRMYEGLTSSPDDLSALHYIVTQFDSSSTQAEILEAALAGSGRFANRAAVFIGQEDGFRGWGSFGFAEEVKEFSRATFSVESFVAFAKLQQAEGSIPMSAADCGLLCEEVGAEAAVEGILIPIVLGDNIAGALYSDRLEGADNFNVFALQLLTYAAAQAIEALPLRSRQSTATLHIVSEELGAEAALEVEEVEVLAADSETEVDEVETPSAEGDFEVEEIEAAAADADLEFEEVEAQVAETEPYVEIEEESVAIEEPADEETEAITEIAEGEERLLEEVSDSLYVDSSKDDLEAAETAEPEFVDQGSADVEAEETELEAFGESAEEASEEVEDLPVEEGDEIEVSEELVVETAPVEEAATEEEFVAEGASFELDDSTQDTAAEQDLEVEPPFESEVSSPELTAESEVEETAADFAEATVYSEPSMAETDATAATIEPYDIPVEETATAESPELSEAVDAVDTFEAVEPVEAAESSDELSERVEETMADESPELAETAEAIDTFEAVEPVELVEPVEAAESIELSEPVEAEAEASSDLYVEDYSTTDTVDSTVSSYEAETSAEPPLADQQADHLQPTGEPSTIFSQTAGIPHIPAPGSTSAPEAPPVSGAEIAPPSDLEGPGWAFTATTPSGTSPEDAKREEAKRLARLLITEIKLYNEEEVEEGRQSRDLVRRLGEEIDRSKQIYDNRIDESIRSEADFFQEELVNILAGGDADAL